MKKVFVILAVIVMAGCSNMHMPGHSRSSGSTSSSNIGSSSMSSDTQSQSSGMYSDRASMNPYSADAVAPTMYLP
ncbi:hypothetical protein EDC30_105237 [Paucimonas lemoignei]|uniref:Lipoprotein n=1 Tax=Paucimonas lemoignei TaxID=29443 RepID=A0A4R3HW59_PAULE|nr:hypothetical protein EDC30_105237 [Paucimonas lemoignei]